MVREVATVFDEIDTCRKTTLLVLLLLPTTDDPLVGDRLKCFILGTG